MFYLLRHPENTSLILLKEEFGLWVTQEKYRDESSKKEILEDIEYFENYLNNNPEGKKQQERLKINVSKTFYHDKFKGRFNNEWYRRKIYADESLKMQDTTCASLSQSSHANIARSRVEIKYDPIPSPHFFKILTDFSFFNLYCFFNASFQTINQINELENTKKFIISSQQELESYFAMTHLFPDVPEYMENLVPYPTK